MTRLLIGCAGWLLACSAGATVYPYQGCFDLASEAYDLPVQVVLAVAATESNWDADARSDADAHGVMQIQWPGTAHHLGVKRVAELYNPCLNISLGARYLRELLDRYHGDLDRALAAYNYGPGRIGHTGGIPPGAQRYIDRVHRHRRHISAGHTEDIRRIATKLINGHTFDSSLRASRYARALTAQVHSVRFASSNLGDGRYLVTMQQIDDEMSVSDARVLVALGWTTPNLPEEVR